MDADACGPPDQSDQIEFKPQEDSFIEVVPEKLSPMQESVAAELSRRVFGQERAIERVSSALGIAFSRLNNPQKPLAVLMFVGPSGVGKTLLAEELSRVWLGEAAEDDAYSPLVKINCENFSSEHESASLKGAPPGYIGYGDALGIERVGMSDSLRRTKRFNDEIQRWYQEASGELAKIYPNSPSEVLQNFLNENFGARMFGILNKATKLSYFGPPRSIVLFDEFEKAHKKVQQQLLDILEKGVLVTHSGRTVNFRGSIIILTSNLGTMQINEFLRRGFQEKRRIGFDTGAVSAARHAQDTDKRIYEMAHKEVRKKLDPALYSRIGGSSGIVVFRPLGRVQFAQIFDAEVKQFQEQLIQEPNSRPILIHVSERFKDFILDKADKPEVGGRQIPALITRYMRNEFARHTMNLRIGDIILFDVENGKVIIRRQRRPSSSLPDWLISEDKKAKDIEFIWQEFLNDLDKERNFFEQTFVTPHLRQGDLPVSATDRKSGRKKSDKPIEKPRAS